MFLLNGLALCLAVLRVATPAAAAKPAKCGAHGWDLVTKSGLGPCEIASLMVGRGEYLEDSPYAPLSDLGRDHYAIPLPKEADELRCNPVFYNLVAGCAACQSVSSTKWSDWATWTAHCNNKISGFKYISDTMPYDTPLPNWAFTDPLATNGTFNKAGAIAIGVAADNVPELVFNVKSEAKVQTSSKSTVQAGPIAGAAVGGAAFGLIVGALVMFLLRKKAAPAAKDNGSVHSRESDDTIMREKAQFARA